MLYLNGRMAGKIIVAGSEQPAHAFFSLSITCDSCSPLNFPTHISSS
jgi:hypothetical protein